MPSSGVERQIVGRRKSFPHDQVLRNHSVGSKCSVAVSGPRFHVVTRIKISSSLPFAYSVNTSK
jgi:hypothetical protein